MFSIFSMVFLNAKKSESSDVCQKARKNQNYKQMEHFVFKDAPDTHMIGLEDKKRFENLHKSQTYNYENKSEFKFKFTPGTDKCNIVGG